MSRGIWREHLRSENHETFAGQDRSLKPTDRLGKLGIRPKTILALSESGIETICDLKSKTSRQIYYTPKIAPARAIEIFRALRDHGLLLGADDTLKASLALRLEARRTFAKGARSRIAGATPAEMQPSTAGRSHGCTGAKHVAPGSDCAV
jgi:hypothetical protein